MAADGSLLRELLHAQKGDFAFRYSLAHASVAKGKDTKPHRLKFTEVYYILEGRGRMHIDDEYRDVRPGCSVYIPASASQYIENIGDSDLKFLCIVDPAWQADAEDIL